MKLHTPIQNIWVKAVQVDFNFYFGNSSGPQVLQKDGTPLTARFRFKKKPRYE